MSAFVDRLLKGEDVVGIPKNAKSLDDKKIYTTMSFHNGRNDNVRVVEKNPYNSSYIEIGFIVKDSEGKDRFYVYNNSDKNKLADMFDIEMSEMENPERLMESAYTEFMKMYVRHCISSATINEVADRTGEVLRNDTEQIANMSLYDYLMSKVDFSDFYVQDRVKVLSYVLAEDKNGLMEFMKSGTVATPDKVFNYILAYNKVKEMYELPQFYSDTWRNREILHTTQNALEKGEYVGVRVNTELANGTNKGVLVGYDLSDYLIDGQIYAKIESVGSYGNVGKYEIPLNDISSLTIDNRNVFNRIEFDKKIYTEEFRDEMRGVLNSSVDYSR